MNFPTFQDGMFPKCRQLFLCRAQILRIRYGFPVDLRPGMWYDVCVGSDFSGLFFVARIPLSLSWTKCVLTLGPLHHCVVPLPHRGRQEASAHVASQNDRLGALLNKADKHKRKRTEKSAPTHLSYHNPSFKSTAKWPRHFKICVPHKIRCVHLGNIPSWKVEKIMLSYSHKEEIPKQVILWWTTKSKREIW